MEEEARDILRAALSAEGSASGDLGKSIRNRLTHLGGVDLPDIPREPIRNPVEFVE